MLYSFSFKKLLYRAHAMPRLFSHCQRSTPSRLDVRRTAESTRSLGRGRPSTMQGNRRSTVVLRSLTSTREPNAVSAMSDGDGAPINRKALLVVESLPKS